MNYIIDKNYLRTYYKPRMNFKNLTILFVVLALTSCKSKLNVTYFQDLENITSGQIASNNANYEAKIVPDDQLVIQVSGMDPAAVAMFNLPAVSFQKTGETNVASTPVLQTYLVNSQGDIEFPVLGKIHVEGMTRTQLSDYLKEKISAYAKNPLVNVKINNFKISVLGEVNSPGTKYISNERITILDAIGMSGDLGLYANRDNILVIRDNNGQKEFNRVDITSSDIMNSPYYYLQQNDVIYVEPNKAKQKNSRLSGKDQYNISIISTIVSVTSVIASLGIALLVK